MIARCTQCQLGHELEIVDVMELKDFKCNNCGSALEVADLRWCLACGKTKQDLEVMNGVVFPGVNLPGTRYFVPPGTTHCPAGHAFRSVERPERD